MLAEERALTRERSAAPPRADAFAAVVEEHWQAVYRLLRSLSGNVHETEDLTQETFLRALQRLASFQPGTNMRNWLMRIASKLSRSPRSPPMRIAEWATSWKSPSRARWHKWR
jgi:RNA polymerase sigma-70 factor, ECF subfamily